MYYLHLRSDTGLLLSSVRHDIGLLPFLYIQYTVQIRIYLLAQELAQVFWQCHCGTTTPVFWYHSPCTLLTWGLQPP